MTTTTGTHTPALTPALTDPVPAPLTLGALTTEQALALADQIAREDVRRELPPNTLHSYANDWRAWCTFFQPHGVDPCQASVALIVAFIRHMRDTGKAVSTIERRVSGVLHHLRHECGVELSSADRDVVRTELKTITRTTAVARTNRGRGQAAALTVKDIRRISAQLPDTLAGARDRAMLLLGFGIAARRSELAALHVEDVQTTPQGLKVDVRWSKTGARNVAVGYGTHELTCPVRAWIQWLTRAEITTGPAFVPVTRHDTLRKHGLSAEGVGDALTRRAAEAGIPGKITGHSLRSGMATESRRAGHDAVTIARQGGWSEGSRVLYRYMRTVDEWADNALVGIGL